MLIFARKTYVCCCGPKYVRAGHLQGQLTTEFLSCLPEGIPNYACQFLFVAPTYIVDDVVIGLCLVTRICCATTCKDLGVQCLDTKLRY